MVQATNGTYIEYIFDKNSLRDYPIIKNMKNLEVDKMRIAVDLYNSEAKEGSRADMVSSSNLVSIANVPALQHYRLVFESSIDNESNNTQSYVKIFEYVSGARILGDGIIELPVTTNTGRQFIYRQASMNGEFIVPYSTIGNPYNVYANEKYHIVGTNKEFDVSEEMIKKGLEIS